MQNMIYLVLLVGSTSALFIQNQGDTSDEETSRTDSLLYPLLLNPFQISHWNCFGTTLYQNTAVSDDYTYTVDICITGMIAAKLLFTGHTILEAGGFFADEEFSDEYGAPAAEGYAAPAAVDEYGAPAYQESYGAPKPVYGSHEQRRNGNTPSFRERLSIAYKDLSKAIKKNNPLNSFQ